MKGTLTWALALILMTNIGWSSRRGQEARVEISLDQREVFTSEPYRLTLQPLADGFMYVYALDAGGYVSLLYPVLAEDGRGQARAGHPVVLDPLYAGSTPGIEQLVVVHTREHRPIRSSRHHFLAPDPGDLPDIHARLTRSEKELGNYATALLTVMATNVHEAAVADDDDVERNVHVGLSIHQHHYDYWCPYCDCWHPACTSHRCWCGWEVVHHYHAHSHYGHCFLWGPWHSWWRPPVYYVYVRGGSPWDYDTRPWRARSVWGANRHYSERWRQTESPRLTDPGQWVEAPARRTDDKPEFVDIRKRLDPGYGEKPLPRPPSILSTEQPGDGSAGPGWRSSVISTDDKGGKPGERIRPDQLMPELEKEAPATTKSPKRPKQKGTVTDKKAKQDAKATEATPTKKPESKPEASPTNKEAPPSSTPQEKPSKPTKPRS